MEDEDVKAWAEHAQDSALVAKAPSAAALVSGDTCGTTTLSNRAKAKAGRVEFCISSWVKAPAKAAAAAAAIAKGANAAVFEIEVVNAAPTDLTQIPFVGGYLPFSKHVWIAV